MSKNRRSRREYQRKKNRGLKRGTYRHRPTVRIPDPTAWGVPLRSNWPKGDISMTTETTEKRLIYTVDQTAKLLQISRNLCYRLCRERKIPGVIFLGSKRMVVSAAALTRLLSGTIDKPES